jgi:hypothetical protein
VRADGTVRRRTMNELSIGFGATPNGFSAVSADELNFVEGGSFWSRLKDIAEKVVVGVATALIVKKLQ